MDAGTDARVWSMGGSPTSPDSPTRSRCCIEPICTTMHPSMSLSIGLSECKYLDACASMRIFHLGRLANALEDLAADVDVLLALFVFVGPDHRQVQGRLLLCVIDLDDVRVHVDMSCQQRDAEMRTQRYGDSSAHRKEHWHNTDRHTGEDIACAHEGRQLLTAHNTHSRSMCVWVCMYVRACVRVCTIQGTRCACASRSIRTDAKSPASAAWCSGVRPETRDTSPTAVIKSPLAPQTPAPDGALSSMAAADKTCRTHALLRLRHARCRGVSPLLSSETCAFVCVCV